MAAGAFSDPEVAEFLNGNFISIKVDREQRPDIDRYLMAFLVATTGQGGWPMNVFLAPAVFGGSAAPGGTAEMDAPRPFFAMTYAAVEPRYGMPGFLEILRRVRSFYEEKRDELVPFTAGVLQERGSAESPAVGPAYDDPGDSAEPSAVLADYFRSFDADWGGFGPGPKFPPHCTLLFLTYLSACEVLPAEEQYDVDAMVKTTLDTMQRRGLHDHLQGGFFRYCVDREWTIPHFEKMLYDQALLLWSYSAAYARYGTAHYAEVARGIIRCLDETFRAGELFVSAHDADTGHREGATYLWSMAELREILSARELAGLVDHFELSEDGNFEGRNHLVEPQRAERRRAVDEAVRAKLLAARKRRPQPHTDRKVVTSWNCLTAAALVMAHRYLGLPDALRHAKRTLGALLELHFADGVLHHSSMDGELQPEQYLEDEASLLLLLTLIHQETGETEEEIELFRRRVEGYRSGSAWRESANADFVAVAAERYDHPVPSSPAVAERALLDAAIISGDVYYPGPFGNPLAEDFGNLTTLIRNGYFYTVETPDPLPWKDLPINSVQYPGRRLVTCYRGACRPGLAVPSASSGR